MFIYSLPYGKCLFENNRYKKAAAITPGNALAWRGLSDLYTKSADWAKLVDVTKELIKLTRFEISSNNEFIF